MGAVRVRQGKGFFCQGEGLRFIEVIAIAYGLMAAEGGSPAFGNVFAGIAQVENFPYGFGIAETPAFRKRDNMPAVIASFNDNGKGG